MAQIKVKDRNLQGRLDEAVADRLSKNINFSNSNIFGSPNDHHNKITILAQQKFKHFGRNQFPFFFGDL